MGAREKPSLREFVPDGTLPKVRTGIVGLDEITGGGLPKGRTTLVCGNAGSGKTLFAMEFLVRGATQFDEPGLFISFEESAEDLAENVRSLGFDLPNLIAEKKIVIDSVQIDREDLAETGQFDLDGLFIRIDDAVRLIGAKRVAIDTLEALFAAMPNEGILRAEIRRLFRWLKERSLTAVVTGDSGVETLTRLGLEEYIADCVISLDHRIENQIGTRRLRVVKYRGSLHGTNEYPFFIGEDGFSLLPITSLTLEYMAPRERVSTGIQELDRMFKGEGYYRGSSILLSGGPGTGKSSMAAAFVDASCRRNERCMLFSYEESREQIIRNMESIGIDLSQWERKGLLEIHAVRPTLFGLEMHLLNVRKLVDEFRPLMLAIDPITNFTISPTPWEIRPFLTRLVDLLKTDGITTLFTCLIPGGGNIESSQLAISSLMDAWILLRNFETPGERTRLLSIFKARGLAHSNETREFLLTKDGIKIGNAFRGRKPLTSIEETEEPAENLPRRKRRRF